MNGLTTQEREIPFMTCRELTDFIGECLSGDLSPDERREFDKHLATCIPCQRYLDGYRLTIRAAKAAFANEDDRVPDEVPHELVEAILAARARIG